MRFWDTRPTLLGPRGHSAHRMCHRCPAPSESFDASAHGERVIDAVEVVHNAVMEQVPHAVLDLAAYAIADGPEGFYDQRVKDTLRSIADEEELRHAVLTLISLAKRMDDAGNREAGDHLIDMATYAVKPLRALGANARRFAEDLTRTKTQRLRAFAGDRELKRAPQFGKSRPKGAIELKSLLGQRTGPRRA